MTTQSPTLELLRKHGRRVTPQRAMILTAIEAHDAHVTAEQIYERVRAAHPYVNRSTVYRTLQMLCRDGLVTVTDLGAGSVQYELHRDQPHHHMVCQQCGTVAELDHTLLEPLKVVLKRRYGFKAGIEHFAIFGLCARCQGIVKKAKRTPAKRAAAAGAHRSS
ncbi:MAG: transcriptional repressor [Chloroflexi bacterium]|nr:transcriptional repressor [Chloroflexota bacterium]